MKYGIHERGLPPAWPMPRRLAHAKEAGYDGVQLIISQGKELRLDCTGQELAQVRRWVEEAGLELVDVASDMNWSCSLTSNRADIRQLARTRLERHIEIAAALGAKAVLAVPGFVGMDANPVPIGAAVFDPACEVVDYSAAWCRAQEALGDVLVLAGQLRVQVLLENIWSRFLLSPLEMRAFIDALHSDWVGVYLDTGNCLPHSYPEHWVTALQSKIGRVHLKDYSRKCSGFEGFVPLLEGDVDFTAVRKALAAIGYDGWFTVEQTANPAAPEQTAFDAMERMKRIMREEI